MSNMESYFQEPEDTGSAWQEPSFPSSGLPSRLLTHTHAAPWPWSDLPSQSPLQQNRQLPFHGGTGNEALMISSQ